MKTIKKRIAIPLIIVVVVALVFAFRHPVASYVYGVFGTCNNTIEFSLVDTVSDARILIRDEHDYLIRNGKEGAWDETIREIGNVVFDGESGTYFLYYSGHTGKKNPSTAVFAGVATSSDGNVWHKAGKALQIPSEDPYVLRHGGSFYMFFEDKSEEPYRNIDIAASEDGVHFSVLRKDILLPSGEGWQSDDVSSPVVVWSEADQLWVMLYEGRGAENQGMIGYATSSDLLGWHAAREPIIWKKNASVSKWFTWDNFFVPDAILLQKDGTFVLTYHAFGMQHMWQTGVAVSSDLRHWERDWKEAIHRSSTVMLNPYNGKAYLYDGTGIAYYLPGIETEFGGYSHCMREFEEYLRI